MKKNVLVIFGGKSTEHDISILSSLQVMENLDNEKYEILPVYITKQGEWLFSESFKCVETFKNFVISKKMKKCTIVPNSDMLFLKGIGGFKPYKKIDCAFIVMHGLNGEDGTMQGLFELTNIPYSSSSILASCIGIDKLTQKRVFESLDFPIVPYTVLNKTEYEKFGKSFNFNKQLLPVVVKPNRLGSSIGISLCKTLKQLKNALDLAFKFDDTVLIESAIKKIKEVNISVLGDFDSFELSETEQPLSSEEILTFNEKYLNGKKSKGCKTGKFKCDNKLTKEKGMQNISRIIPAKITDNQRSIIENIASEIFVELKCSGIIRIDFMIDEETEKVYVNEINTIPGSLAYYLWENKGYDFKKLLDKLFDIAIIKKQKQDKFIFTFDSKILK